MPVHIVEPDGVMHDSYEVWLSTEIQDFDGLCIGTGDTREVALDDARQTLQRVTLTLDAEFEACSNR